MWSLQIKQPRCHLAYTRCTCQKNNTTQDKTSVFPPAVNLRCVSRFNTGPDVCPPDDHRALSTSSPRKYHNTNKLQSPVLKVKLVPCNCLLLCMFCSEPVSWSLCLCVSTSYTSQSTSTLLGADGSHLEGPLGLFTYSVWETQVGSLSLHILETLFRKEAVLRFFKLWKVFLVSYCLLAGGWCGHQYGFMSWR